MPQVMPNSPHPLKGQAIVSNAGIGIDSSTETVPQLVAARAHNAPNAVAVSHGSEVLTYGELEARASRLALALSSVGFAPDRLVGLYVERSLGMVVGALGIMKAGGAYVPLSPADPLERLKYLIADAGISLLVTQSHLLGQLPAGASCIIDLDDLQRRSFDSVTFPLIACPQREDVAYVIYTSGSTGQPKGVQVTHRNLMNLVWWHRRSFDVSPADRSSQVASPGFDAAVWELWPYLTAGASVHIVEEYLRRSAEDLRDWLIAEEITVSFIPTALAELIIGLNWPPDSCLRYLLTGADTLHRYPTAALPFVLVNNYGPTECTVVATSGMVPAQAHSETLPPIGRPIDNTSIYILDAQLREVAPGGEGEICIGGEGVTRGYLNRPELTAAKFVADPFGADPARRLFRTGDLGKYLTDGQLAFLGRIDEQVKIRGYRIEPNEISSILDRHPLIRHSIVSVREDRPGDHYLAAYVIPQLGSQPSESSLREYLALQLPPHMIPARFVELESLPLTPNGKIDRAALPPPTVMNELKGGAVAAPRTPTEIRLAEIAAALLNREQVSINDNFFLLGGHSLLGTQFVTQVHDAFGVELTLRALFGAPTLAELALTVDRLVDHQASLKQSASLTYESD